VGEFIFDAVCVGAHPDDVEIGMGGTLAAMTAAGKRVAIVDLTNGEPTPHGTVEQRAVESAMAAEILGAERRTLTQPNRYLFDTVEARMELAEVLREFRPRMMFVPFGTDAHPDHIAASAIAVAARFYGKLTKTSMSHEPYFVPRVFRYMAVHQRVIAEPSFVIDIKDSLPVKLRALAAYESQFSANPANSNIIPMIEQMAAMWGSIAGVQAGEPFFALEPIALSSPDSVL
jgi:bacillithiol biosynthesis deacetylase BshB1